MSESLPEHPDSEDEDRYVYGKVQEQTAVEIDGIGVITKVNDEASFVIDTRTQQIVQMGGDKIVVSEISFIADMLARDPAEFWPDLAEGGESGE